MDFLINKFRTSKYYYIYDATTNQILRVDSQVYNFVNDNGSPNREMKQIIECAHDDMGIFCSSRLRGLEFPMKQNIKEKLKNELKQLILNVTEDCNMRCKYCKASGAYFYERRYSSKYMPSHIAERAVNFFLNHSSKSQHAAISFFGGEPLLNFNVVQHAVEYATSKISQERKIHFSITTNGTLLSDKIINFLMQHNFHLYISLDGPKDIHNRNRIFKNGKGSFDKIMQNLQKIKRISSEHFHSKVGINVTLTPPWEMDKIKSFFEDFGISSDKIVFNIVDPYDNIFVRKSDIRKFNFHRLRNEYKKSILKKGDGGLFASWWNKDLAKIVNRPMTPLGDYCYPNGACIPGTQRLFVDVEGNFYTCERMRYSFPIGNVKLGFNFDKIYNLMNDYIKLRSEDCINCWAVRFCDACYISVKTGDELSKRRARENCEGIRNYFHNLLILYCEIMENDPNVLNFLKVET